MSFLFRGWKNSERSRNLWIRDLCREVDSGRRKKKKNPAGQPVVLQGCVGRAFPLGSKGFFPQANMVKESPITHQLNALSIHKDARMDF